MQSVSIAAVEVFALRAPLEKPVRTSFGVMADRPAVFVRVRDSEGAAGWGEAWCNFPPVGAEHRARLIRSLLAPALIAAGPLPPGDVYERLMKQFRIMALQAGEWGPFRQCAAALDIACHDLAARRAGLPLWRYLGGAGDGRIRAYASGLDARDLDETVPAERAAGHRAFKLKVGFGEAADLAGLQRLAALAGPDAVLMADANQAWAPREAARMAAAFAGHRLLWLEEPVAADQPPEVWQALAARSPVPLAAGENIAEEAAFDAAIASGSFVYLQPDACKWGGIAGCLAVAKRALAAGRTYCPHFLGGGIGLLASAHLLAAAGGRGLLEMDVQPNPLREEIAQGFMALEDGLLTLGAAPGLGPDDRHLAPLIARFG